MGDKGKKSVKSSKVKKSKKEESEESEINQSDSDEDIKVIKYKNKEEEEENLNKFIEGKEKEDDSDDEEKLEENRKLLEKEQERKKAYMKNYGPTKQHLFDTPGGFELKKDLLRKDLYGKSEKELLKETIRLKVVDSFELDEFSEIHTKSKKGKEILKKIIELMVFHKINEPFTNALKFYNEGFFNCEFSDTSEIDKFLSKLRKHK